MSVKSVKKLKELTGCSSVDCRNAIEYCDNDFDTAYKYLQFINQAKARYKMVYGVRVPWKKEDYRNEARKHVSKLNIKTLKEFLELEDDWDGEGAKRFDKEFIDFLCQEILTMPIQPDDIFPLQDGSVVFEFGNVRNYYLEIKLSPHHYIKVYRRFADKETSGNIYFEYSRKIINDEIKNYLRQSHRKGDV